MPSPQPTIEPVTRLVFTGDLIPARCSYTQIAATGDWTSPFRPLHDTLSGADITIATLDTTLSPVSQPIGCTPTFNLAAPPEAIEGIAYAGYDVISHAANHIKDCGNANCGDQAMLDTIAALRARGIQPVGSGANIAEARAPVVVERNGVYFAFLAYDDIAAYYHADDTYGGAAPMDEATIAEDVMNARKVADIVVVMPHWGVEYVADPNERQRSFARAAAAAGADLVVGNHPHWVQGYEQIGDTFVAYALGNFIFDQDWSLETLQGAMLEVTFRGEKLTTTKFTPIHIYDQYQPRLAPLDEAAAILDRIEGAAAKLRATP